MTDPARPVPPGIDETFRSWRSQARMLRVIHVSLMLAASAFSILSAAAVGGTAWQPQFALVAAVSVGIMSALDLGVKANGFRNAWRHMNAAMARYHSVPAYTVEQLIQAYETAEALIGDLPSGPRPELPRRSPPPEMLPPPGRAPSGAGVRSEFEKI